MTIRGYDVSSLQKLVDRKPSGHFDTPNVLTSLIVPLTVMAVVVVAVLAIYFI